MDLGKLGLYIKHLRVGHINLDANKKPQILPRGRISSNSQTTQVKEIQEQFSRLAPVLKDCREGSSICTGGTEICKVDRVTRATGIQESTVLSEDLRSEVARDRLKLLGNSYQWDVVRPGVMISMSIECRS